MAFARRAMRFSSSPSLAIFTKSARSAALRKLRFVFTRRLESILLIRSNDCQEGRGIALYRLHGKGFRPDRLRRRLREVRDPDRPSSAAVSAQQPSCSVGEAEL